MNELGGPVSKFGSRTKLIRMKSAAFHAAEMSVPAGSGSAGSTTMPLWSYSPEVLSTFQSRTPAAAWKFHVNEKSAAIFEYIPSPIVTVTSEAVGLWTAKGAGPARPGAIWVTNRGRWTPPSEPRVRNRGATY